MDRFTEGPEPRPVEFCEGCGEDILEGEEYRKGPDGDCYHDGTCFDNYIDGLYTKEVAELGEDFI